MSFPFLYVLNSLQFSLTVVGEKSTWDQANRWQKLGLVWRNRKKISQIINDYLYIPFCLLITYFLGCSDDGRLYSLVIYSTSSSSSSSWNYQNLAAEQPLPGQAIHYGPSVTVQSHLPATPLQLTWAGRYVEPAF
jgi:hypothetical protein